MKAWDMQRFGLTVWGCLLLSLVHGLSYSQKIPIGALFSNDSGDIKAAFNYKIADRNKNPARVRLSASHHTLAMDDSYAVTMKTCRLMSNGIFALFGTHEADSVNALKSYSATFRMPYITPSMAYNETGQELGYELYMMPYYVRALLDVCKQYGWDKVFYVYDSDEGLMRVQQLFGAISLDGYALKVDLYRVQSVPGAYELLAALNARPEDSMSIMLDMETNDIDQLFNMSRNTGILLRFNFLLVGLGVREMALEAWKSNGGINITGLVLVDFDNQRVQSFLEEWHKLSQETFPGAGREIISYQAALTMDAVGIIHQALTKMVINTPTIFDRNLRLAGKVFNNKTEGINCDAEPVLPWEHGHEIMKALREINYDGLTGLVQFDRFGLRRNFALDLWEMHKNQPLKRIGEWHSRKGLGIKEPSGRPRPVPSSNPNSPIVITSILGEPYLSERTDPSGKKLLGNDRFEGYCADLAKEIADELGIQYTIQVVKDGGYGSRNENGSWNGMVGELVRHEAEMVVAPLTITSEREAIIDFSKPFMSLGISIMIKKMTKQAPGVFSFMYPLSYEIWMCVIFAYIGVSVVLFLVSRFSPFEWHIEDNTEGPTVTNNFTIFNSLWFSLGAFMQQGCDIEPRSMSGRIVGSVWWFFTLIIISSYTANLAAFLTVQRMKAPIESAEDLSKQTEIKYGTVDSGTTREFFRTSTIPVYERMWAFMDSAEPSVFVKTNNEGVARVRKADGKYAFLMESTTNDYVNERQPCDTMKVGSNLDSKGYGIATPKGSAYRDRVTLVVLQLREKGALQKLEKKWWYDKGECGKDTAGAKEATNSLKLGNVAGIFYILTSGLLLALLMALVEFLYKSKMEARRRKTSFTNAVRTKARLSIKGKPERQTTAYTYAPAAQLISLDGYADGANTHTQV